MCTQKHDYTTSNLVSKCFGHIYIHTHSIDACTAWRRVLLLLTHINIYIHTAWMPWLQVASAGRKYIHTYIQYIHERSQYTATLAATVLCRSSALASAPTELLPVVAPAALSSSFSRESLHVILCHAMFDHYKGVTFLCLCEGIRLV